MITRIVHNVETNEIFEVEVDSQEIELNLLEKTRSENEATAKAAAKAAAEVKLAALGLTADDLRALGLGSN
jgi:hypothetical protein